MNGFLASFKYGPHVEKIIIMGLLCYIVLEKTYSNIIIEEQIGIVTESLEQTDKLRNVTKHFVSNTTEHRLFDTENLPPKDRFASRKEHLLKSCRREGILGLENYLVEEKSLPRPNILYLDDYQLIYCGIPKVSQHSRYTT